MQRGSALKRFLILLCIVLVGSGLAEAEVIFQRSDPRGDDYGSGKLLYPEHAVYESGLFDLQRFSVGREEGNIYFDFRFAKISNPFQAPEGFFHQRLEVYISTGEGAGQKKITIGSHEFKTAPGQGWQIRLAVAPFGESKLFLAQGGQIFLSGIYPELLDDGATIRVWVDGDLMPEPDKSWRYYVLVGSFDGLAPDFWRDVGSGPWQVGGEGPPVFDLLAPCWGRYNQKNQLSSLTLQPVGMGALNSPIIILSACFVGLLVGGIVLWRWFRVRT